MAKLIARALYDLGELTCLASFLAFIYAVCIATKGI